MLQFAQDLNQAFFSFWYNDHFELGGYSQL